MACTAWCGPKNAYGMSLMVAVLTAAAPSPAFSTAHSARRYDRRPAHGEDGIRRDERAEQQDRPRRPPIDQAAANDRHGNQREVEDRHQPCHPPPTQVKLLGQRKLDTAQQREDHAKHDRAADRNGGDELVVGHGNLAGAAHGRFGLPRPIRRSPLPGYFVFCMMTFAAMPAEVNLSAVAVSGLGTALPRLRPGK